ncbi:MAG: transporter associated domain-containing protein [Gammaproteobacteria bacterium]
MTDDDSDERSGGTWFGRLRQIIKGDTATREDLHQLLRDAHESTVLDADELAMLEGVLAVSEIQVRDVMVPRSQMVVLERDASREEILKTVVESGHSRFPLIGSDREEVVGILLAKDVLRYVVEASEQPFDITRWLRPATFIPESKRLNTLLKELRISRNHLAVVVDEYGGLTGLITIEDVLEEIVGEIDDEFDSAEAGPIQQQEPGVYHLRALTRIDEFNEFFDASLEDEHYDTVGGLVMYALGHLPRRGETVNVGEFSFRVLQADRRRIHSVEVARRAPSAEDGDTAVA